MIRALPILALLGLQACSAPRVAGVFYQPKPEDRDGLRAAVEGESGGSVAIQRALAPVVRFASEGAPYEVWQEYLQAAMRHHADGFRSVLDLHTLASRKWLDRGYVEQVVRDILTSDLRPAVAGFYVCDEPFGRSRPGRPKPVDLGPIDDVVRTVRRVASELDVHVDVYADYAATAPLLAVGGDPVRGAPGDHTADPDERESFFWRGEWVRSTEDGRRRGVGFFGEDITLINWWSGAESLPKWAPMLLSPDRTTHLVVGYDTSPDSRRHNAEHAERIRAVATAARELGFRGLWLWPWAGIPAGGQTYKGVRDWWAREVPGPMRYAAIIEEWVAAGD